MLWKERDFGDCPCALSLLLCCVFSSGVSHQQYELTGQDFRFSSLVSACSAGTFVFPTSRASKTHGPWRFSVLGHQNYMKTQLHKLRLKLFPKTLGRHFWLPWPPNRMKPLSKFVELNPITRLDAIWTRRDPTKAPTHTSVNPETGNITLLISEITYATLYLNLRTQDRNRKYRSPHS